jgi:hypothetical protein
MGDRGYYSSDVGASEKVPKVGTIVRPFGTGAKGRHSFSILRASDLVGGRVASLSSTIERRVLGDGLATMMAIAAVSLVRICAGDR